MLIRSEEDQAMAVPKRRHPIRRACGKQQIGLSRTVEGELVTRTCAALYLEVFAR